MRIAIVAGPDAGHAVPAIALAGRLAAAGESVTVFTGARWLPGTEPARPIPDGVTMAELPGLDALETDDDSDAGAKLSTRAARMSTALIPVLAEAAVDLLICDVITLCGGWAAEHLGIAWIELSPHPLYEPSVGLPPVGSGLAPGTGLRGALRDRLLRAAAARSQARGIRQRAVARESIGLSSRAPGPRAQLIATLPALEVQRPDWPVHAHVVGPLLWEPTRQLFTPPAGSAPLVVVAPSTALTGVDDLVDIALEAMDPERTGVEVRVVISALHHGLRALPSWAVAGAGRQDEVLSKADLVICGGGHGMLAKSLLAGVPVVAVPGGGDQWELANRVARQGSGDLVRPLTAQTLRSAYLRVLGDPSAAAAARRAAVGAVDVADPVVVCRSVFDD